VEGNTLYVTSKASEFQIAEGEMKGKLLLGGFMLLTIALIALATGCNSQGQSITVLNPALSTEMAERVPLAPRTETLEGKTIYLVDMQWGGPDAGYSVFEEMQKWFSRNMPSVKVELRRTQNGWMGDDPALRKEIVDKGAAGAVIGIGG
jgi:hypothetical protein